MHLLIALLILLGLYSPDAGFEQAREGTSLRVHVPQAWDLKVRPTLRGWNDRAGWPLFVRTHRRARADIRFFDPDRPNDGYPPGLYAVPLNASDEFVLREPYSSCEVYVSIHTASVPSRRYAQHELGHCLGFDHRARGVMGDWRTWHRSDRWMLRKAGYRP